MQNKSRLTIWVCEFISAGGLCAETLPDSLLQEGLLMRDALLADLSAINVDCITSHDWRVPAPTSATSHVIHGGDDVWAIWRQQLDSGSIDACLVIAPETDGMLLAMHQLVSEAGKVWIGSSASAIKQTSVKSKMAELCQQAGICVLPHVFLSEPITALTTLFSEAVVNDSWVIKPDDGAGCDSIFYFENIKEVIDFKNKNIYSISVNLSHFLLQPYIAGLALSMSVISTRSDVKVIACHEQYIQIEDGCFKFNGAGVNAAASQLTAMQHIAEQIHTAIPGLCGYWGADLILTPEQKLVLVEINPRLTTPYIALSTLLHDNPAQMILDATLKQSLSEIQATGTVSLCLNDKSHTQEVYRV